MYNSHAEVSIENNFPGIADKIVLQHRYSNDQVYSQTWTNVESNTVTTPMKVNFNTGKLRTGSDWWHIELTFDGVTWSNSGFKGCQLQKTDAGKSMIFVANVGNFKLNIPSGSCYTSLICANGANSMAAVYVKNDFPVLLDLTLSHHYSSNSYKTEKSWSRLAPGQKTPTPLYVYFNSGGISTDSDHWNVDVILDIVPPKDKEIELFQGILNATKDKGCMLKSDDVGKAMTFTINGNKFLMDIPSGSCTDQWKTPNNYNTMAFIKLENNSENQIVTYELSHQYSTDETFHFEGGFIEQSKGLSSDYMMVEYNTGPGRTGYDYWNLSVVFDNGNLYRNSQKDKRCYLTADDATALTFLISQSQFDIILPSGSCSTGMSKIGPEDFGLGIDPTRRYDENAYLASHNSFSSYAYGYIYVQQSLYILDQLCYGVRTLLLDIYNYQDDIYLFHGDGFRRIVTELPFGRLLKLSDVLKEVKTFMDTISTVVTIVFEDHVEAAYRNKIMPAFALAGLQDKIFDLKTVDPEKEGWPILKDMINSGKNLVVFSSNKADPFQNFYQWDYMSENVYGTASTNPKTWLNPREESGPLNTKRLCAINNFNTITTVPNFDFISWITQSLPVNKSDTLNSHVDACYSKYQRFPTYLNLDFITMPNDEPKQVIIRLNSLWSSKPSYPSAILNRLESNSPKLISSELMFDRQDTPQLAAERVSLALELSPKKLESNILLKCFNWVDNNINFFLIPHKELTEYNIGKHFSVLINLVFVLKVLMVLFRENVLISSWVSKHSKTIKEYLDDFDSFSRLNDLLHAECLSGSNDLFFLYPFLMIEREDNQQWKILDVLIEKYTNQKYRQIVEHDTELSSLSLLGYEIDLKTYRNRIMENIQTPIEERILNSQFDYELAHLIFAISHGSRSFIDYCQEEFLPAVHEILLNGMIRSQYSGNMDILAELFIAYVFTAGPPSISINNLMESLTRRITANGIPENFSGYRRVEDGMQDCEKSCCHGVPEESYLAFQKYMHITLVSLLSFAIYSHSTWFDKPIVKINFLAEESGDLKIPVAIKSEPRVYGYGRFFNSAIISNDAMKNVSTEHVVAPTM